MYFQSLPCYLGGGQCYTWQYRVYGSYFTLFSIEQIDVCVCVFECLLLYICGSVIRFHAHIQYIRYGIIQAFNGISKMKHFGTIACAATLSSFPQWLLFLCDYAKNTQAFKYQLKHTLKGGVNNIHGRYHSQPGILEVRKLHLAPYVWFMQPLESNLG